MKIVQFRIFKIILVHSPNMRNESVRILIIRGMNLFIYSEYAERICMYMENTRNEVNLLTKFHCSYNEKKQNKSVLILRICGTDLHVY
jgi:hypothetical protein